MNEEIRNTTEAARNSSELANIFYSDIRPVVQPVAKCIGALIELAVNPIFFYSEKARVNFKHRLEQYQKKMENVKEEDKCYVHPEIGVPIMQVLYYTTNDDIAEMFTNLLVSASICHMAGNAHPAFVEIIKQMSPDEAKIVQFLQKEVHIGYVTLKANQKDKVGFITPVLKDVGIAGLVPLMYKQNAKIYISNLLSLGILDDAGNEFLNNEDMYKQIIEYNNLKEVKEKYEHMEDYSSVDIEKGYFYVTEIGRLFINTCCNTGRTSEKRSNNECKNDNNGSASIETCEAIIDELE